MASRLRPNTAFGLLKKPYLHSSRRAEEAGLMRQLKRFFDPALILNPVSCCRTETATDVRIQLRIPSHARDWIRKLMRRKGKE